MVFWFGGRDYGGFGNGFGLVETIRVLLGILRLVLLNWRDMI